MVESAVVLLSYSISELGVTEIPYSEAMPKVELIVHATAAEGKVDELRKELTAMLAPTHAEEGCEFYRLFESSRTGHFFLYELWSSAEALEAHRRTPHLLRLKSLTTSIMERPLDGYTVTEITG
jgi:quinol monooxygenase YgiN